MTALSTLYARFDAIAKGSEKGNSSAVHGAILDRLAANRRSADPARRAFMACVA